jgi:hypothetical protein
MAGHLLGGAGRVHKPGLIDFQREAERRNAWTALLADHTATQQDHTSWNFVLGITIVVENITRDHEPPLLPVRDEMTLLGEVAFFRRLVEQLRLQIREVRVDQCSE